jgi:hypothetical protein
VRWVQSARRVACTHQRSEAPHLFGALQLHSQLVNKPKVTWLPGLIEPRLQWAIQAKQHAITLIRNRLYPILLMALGRLRTKSHSRCPIGVYHQAGRVAVETTRLLIGFKN